MSVPAVPRLQLPRRPVHLPPEPVLFTRRFWNNKPLLGAFLVGALLLSAVLVIPPLEELMQAVALPWQLGLAIPALAVGSMVVIQLLKAIRVRLRKAS